MAITQPGDTTVISPLSVPADAGPAIRAESVLGGFVSLPSGSGPPTTTNLPLVMRRVGTLAYTPTDNKFWQLIGGTADANWAEKTIGKGGLITVATNADRDALPVGIRTEGMIVYSQQTKCYYSLAADLSTWTFIDSNPAVNSQANWYINASTGNDANDGVGSGTALATTEELCRRLNGSRRYIPNQFTTVHLAAGNYGELYLRASAPQSFGALDHILSIVGEISSSASITLSAVVNTTASSTSGVRGQVTTAGSTSFTANKRIRSTSGAHVGACTYSTGQNANSKNHFVKEWYDYDTSSVVTIANGTTCVVDTLLSSIARLNLEFEGPGYIDIIDAKLSNELNARSHAIGGTIDLVGCEYVANTFGAGHADIYGSVAFWNCNFVSGRADFSEQFPAITGCVVQSGAELRTFPACTLGLFAGNCINGGKISAVEPGGSLYIGTNLEFTNGGSGAALDLQTGAVCVQVSGLSWGVSTSYDIGLRMGSLCKISTPSATTISIPATIKLQMTGINLPYGPRAYASADCIWALDPDSTAIASVSAAWRAQAAWYINASTGSDLNDGSSTSPLASLDELRARLNPGGGTLFVSQSTAVHIAAGTYNSLELSVSIPVGSGYTFDVLCDYTSGSPITLSSVTNTVASSTPTRGNIQTASGTFVDKARIRSTSGASVGAITYCTGLNGGATNAWVKRWFLESSFVPVNISSSTTCVIDTLQVTINRVHITNGGGHPVGGQIRIFDAILPNGAELTNAIGGSSSLNLSQCRIGSASVSRLSGNIQLRNCQLTGASATVFFGLPLPVMTGCSIENQVIVVSTVQLSGACCVNGGTFLVGGQGNVFQASLALSDTEWVNGSGTALTVSPGSVVQVLDQQYGFGSVYAVGYDLAAGVVVITDTVAHASGILATQHVAMSGKNVLYSELPKVLPRTQCAFVLLSDPTAPSLVESVFGRTGAVVATAGDYNSTQITNSSSVSGSTVTAALNTLLASISGGGAVVSVFGRTGAISAALNDYTSSLVQNISSVTSGGSTVTTALNSLQSQATSVSTTLSSLVTGVSSVFGRTNAVNAASGDYNSTQITNGSSVSGGNVTVALDTLKAALPTAGPIVSVFGRTGAVASATNDYSSTQVSNSSSVTSGGSSVTTALNSLQTQTSAKISSVFGRTGPAVTAATGDYAASQITNDAGHFFGASDVATVLDRLASGYPNGTFAIPTAGSYTLSASLLGYLIELGGVGTYTITIPTSASSGIPVGAVFSVLQYQPGSVLSPALASGVSVLNTVQITSNVYTRYVFTQVATDIWTIDTVTNITSSETRHYPLMAGFPFTYWGFTPGTGLISTGTGGSGSLYVPIGPFANNEYITSIGATFKAASGHASLPTSGNKPVIKVWAQSQTGSPGTALGSAADPSVSVAAYQAVHSWSAAVSPAVSCANTHFWAEFVDEVSGSGALGGLLIGISATISKT